MSAQLAPIEVFYSYADADKDLHSELHKHLSQLCRDGLITTWHKRQIIAGQDWTKTLDRHLNTASVILLLVSADFVASDYCYGTEMQRAVERHDAGKARVIPILLRPVDWQSAPFGNLQTLPSNGIPITMWCNRDEAFTDIAQGIRAMLQEVQRLAVTTPHTSLPRIWNIPYPRNPVFTGREEILSQIETQMQAGQATAISQAQALSGLGGIGKTQVAIEYAYRYHHDYLTVFWTPADTRESLVSGYISIAGLLNLPEKNEQNQTIIIKAVMRWLTTMTSWLLILDNTDDLTVVREFIPPVFGGRILLTTRVQAMGRLAGRIEVDTMPLDIGALFLLRRALLIAPDAPLEDTATTNVAIAREICEELGGLPLALDQAGAYIEEAQCSLLDYQQRYRTRRAHLLQRRGGLVADYPESVATTWSLSFEKVEQRSLIAADLLRLCAFLHPDAIPIELINEEASRLVPSLVPVAEDDVALDETIAVLGAYSLVQRDPIGKTLSIHRLVQAVLQDKLEEAERLNWAERAVYVVKASFPEVTIQTWQQCERYVPHAQTCVDAQANRESATPEIARLLTQLGRYKKMQHIYREEALQDARHYFERALKINTELVQAGKQGDLEQAKNYDDLGDIYRYQEDREQAIHFYRCALVIREKDANSHGRDIAYGYKKIANLYDKLGKEEEAIFYYIIAIKHFKSVFGENHNKVIAISMTFKNRFGVLHTNSE